MPSTTGEEYPSTNQKVNMEKDIQGAVVHNFLSEKQSDIGNNSGIFTSSDTVNELLQGLACNTQNQDQELIDLAKATADVLPMFSKALDSSSKSSNGKLT